jgi:anti-sigma B factor antagonist
MILAPARCVVVEWQLAWTVNAEESIDDFVTVLRPHGRLDVRSAQSMRERLAELAADGKALVVVDLGLVPFMDSSGLSTLVSALKSLRQGGGDLRIARPPAQVRLILSSTRLDRVFRPYETVEEAVQGASGAAGEPR